MWEMVSRKKLPLLALGIGSADASSNTVLVLERGEVDHRVDHACRRRGKFRCCQVQCCGSADLPVDDGRKI